MFITRIPSDYLLVLPELQEKRNNVTKFASLYSNSSFFMINTLFLKHFAICERVRSVRLQQQ
jgi:hypothetical protein